MKDLDELRSDLEVAMQDLSDVLPHPLDWRPQLIYLMEILDHQASQSGNPEEFTQLLHLLASDLGNRINAGSWSSPSS